MSALNWQGIPIKIGAEERHIYFDYAVIADIQEEYDSDVLSVINELFLEKRSPGEYKGTVLIDLVHRLLLDETERERFFNGKELKSFSRQEVGWLMDQANADEIVMAIIKAWATSLPEAEGGEEENPNAQRGTEQGSGSTSPAQS